MLKIAPDTRISVYRLEFRETRMGPFTGGGMNAYDVTYDWDDSDDSVPQSSCADGPGPSDFREEDTELHAFFSSRSIHKPYYFGFVSLRSFKGWFSHRPGLEALAKEGMVLAEYTVLRKDVRMGLYQLAFHRGKAKHVADYAPDIRTGLPVCVPTKE